MTTFPGELVAVFFIPFFINLVLYLVALLSLLPIFAQWTFRMMIVSMMQMVGAVCAVLVIPLSLELTGKDIFVYSTGLWEISFALVGLYTLAGWIASKFETRPQEEGVQA